MSDSEKKDNQLEDDFEISAEFLDFSTQKSSSSKQINISESCTEKKKPELNSSITISNLTRNTTRKHQNLIEQGTGKEDSKKIDDSNEEEIFDRKKLTSHYPNDLNADELDCESENTLDGLSDSFWGKIEANFDDEENEIEYKGCRDDIANSYCVSKSTQTRNRSKINYILINDKATKKSDNNSENEALFEVNKKKKQTKLKIRDTEELIDPEDL